MEERPEQELEQDTPTRLSRRQVMKYAAGSTIGMAAGCSLCWLLMDSGASAASEPTGIFKGDAPKDSVWEAWQKRGWSREAYHYAKLGRNVQCKICPNGCVLSPGDRSHCRNRINRDGILYTLAYGNPCSIHADPIEKKPLFHFLPGTRTFSLATAGCVLRCLNCQNWEISQKKPEETKDASGPPYRFRPGSRTPASLRDIARMTVLPEDVVALAESLGCPSISYTYSEPIAFYEYTFDTCKLAREKRIRNVLVTSGYIREESLRDLAQYVDGAHVDLKGFDETTYRNLNSGSLRPILETLKTLKSMGVWFEVINLVVPTHTDNPDTIKKMCGWLVENIGPDCPIHFSRFHPAHKLRHLPRTPAEKLMQAREIAQSSGLRYVYIGNIRGIENAETTFCPNCRKAIVERTVYAVHTSHVEKGVCGFCKTRIAGVWGS